MIQKARALSLMAAISCLATSNLAAAVTAPVTGPETRTFIKLRPAANTKFVHTGSTKSMTTVKLAKGGDKKPQSVADVLTNIIEISTKTPEFDGTLPLSVKLVDTKAQAMTQKLHPLPRVSPLKPLVDSVVELNLYFDDTIKLADVRMPGKFDVNAVRTMHQMAETVLFPFRAPELALAVGEHFEVSEIRQFPVEGENVPFELLRKYTLKETSPNYILLDSETVIRPRRREQAQQIFGRGEGTAMVNRFTGVVEKSDDKVVMEAKVLGKKGWVLFKVETETETVTIPLSTH